MRQDLFADFLGKLAELLATQDEEFVVICDNARAHNNPPNFLPRYSPFLNVCEMAGSTLKATIKCLLMDPEMEQKIHKCACAGVKY